jgi:EAL domain-containing protein (putative c-di-GMP-specific phosphodiesterase class I)
VCRPGSHGSHGGGPALASAALRDDRLRLMAQPIVDIRTGELVAEELLALIARAPERESGPVCLRTARSAAVDVDAWMVQRAAYLAAFGRRVHVSLCRRSIVSETFVVRVDRAIERAGADPCALTFEIDEGVAARDADLAAAFATRVAQAGSNLAVNDVSFRFGSPAYLDRLPAALIKIDPWLVRDLFFDHRAATAIHRIVDVAISRGRQVVAEGVEDDDAIVALRSAGVDYVQGFGGLRV